MVSALGRAAATQDIGGKSPPVGSSALVTAANPFCWGASQLGTFAKERKCESWALAGGHRNNPGP